MSSVKDVLMSEKSNITLRNRAIGMLLFFTGMRSSDIAGLTFSDIDWEKEEIRIFQKKTGNELVLPLTARIGNALYDYITMERPQSGSKKIFLCERPPVNPSVQEQLAMMPAGCMKPHPSDKGNRIGKVPIFSGITSQLLFPETTSPAL